MKKLFVAALALLSYVSVASAQDTAQWKWDVEAGLSFSYLDRSGALFNGSNYKNRAEILVARSESPEEAVGHSTVILPTFFVSGGMQIKDTPVYVRLGFYVNHAYNTLYGGPSILEEKETIFHFLPEMRVYYYRGAIFRPYASLGLGLRTRLYWETLRGSTVGNSDFDLTWQITPIGMEFGRKCYATLSYGFGLVNCPCLVGVGYKF